MPSSWPCPCCLTLSYREDAMSDLTLSYREDASKRSESPAVAVARPQGALVRRDSTACQQLKNSVKVGHREAATLGFLLSFFYHLKYSNNLISFLEIC